MSEVKVNKLSPRSGTTVTIGDSGDTISIPSGVTLSNAGTNTFASATITGDLTVDTNTLYVDSANNRVGIGTTSPGFEFEVKDASGASVVRVNNGSANHIVDLIADSTGGLLRTVGSYPLVLNTNQTERARLDTSGNFMVGKTATGIGSAGAEFKSDGRIFSVVSGNYAGLFNRLSSDGEIVQIRRDGTTVGSLDTVGVSTSGRLVVKSTTFDGYLDRAGTTIAKWMSSSFTPGADNTFDLGRGAERWRDLYLSGGAYIGGTGSANKLDDYEEGTWTPSYAGSTTGSISYGSRGGTYTKVGNLVTAWFSLVNFTTTGSWAGDVKVTGLPFTCNQTNNVRVCTGNCRFYNINTPSNTRFQVSMDVDVSNSHLIFLQSGDDTNWESWQVETTSSSYLEGTITYRTDS